jgi:hypothetical protein
VHKFSVRQSDLTIEFRFERPAFGLLGPTSHRFVALIYDNLEQYGISAPDIHYGNAGSLGDRHVLINVPRINAGIKVSIAKFDVGFNELAKVPFPDIEKIVLGAVAALHEVDSSSKIAGCLATLNVHGLLEGSNVIDFIGNYFGSRPTGLGPSTGSASGFYFGAEGPRLHLSIIMDGSVPVQGGLYLRLMTSFDGRKIEVKDALKAGREEFRKAFAALNLAPEVLDLGKPG